MPKLTQAYWQAVGVKTNMIVIEGSLSQEHYETNDIDVSMWGVSGGMMPLTWPRYCVAYNFLGDGGRTGPNILEILNV